MTVYYTLTFALLIAEMITFCILVSPLPYVVRKRVFTFLSENSFVAKIAYGLKITFIFIGILFVDAVQRTFRVTADTEMAKKGGHVMHDARTEANFAARKFYAQRNMYLTGFCLFLSLILTRTFYILLDLVRTQGECTKLKQATTSQSRKNITNENHLQQIEELKSKLAEAKAKELDFETLKKQCAQQAAEYDRLATKYNEATGSISDKRVD